VFTPRRDDPALATPSGRALPSPDDPTMPGVGRSSSNVSMRSVTRRDPWLDVLRATAIAMVLAYHTLQMAPTPIPALWAVARHGHLGVDLFFVLSGWLIGRLYWAEHRRTGRVALWHFWQRRWLRTIPAYAVALLLSWASVAVTRGEPFSWTYLVFLQNYLEKVPFFLVSWSLCVEEHCYLLLPLLLVAAARSSRRVHVVMGALALVPVGALLIQQRPADLADFGFYDTATHFRMGGIVLGFWVSRARVVAPETWPRWQALSTWSLLPLGLLAAWLPQDTHIHRALAVLACTLFFLAALISGTERVTWVPSRAAISWLATTSYSLYLTHALAIHGARMSAARIGGMHPNATYFVTAIVLVAGLGATFYLAVERTSLSMRDRLSPPRRSPAREAAPSAT
jgi:peptidoglycan/LPS O-acetylase OafA/YrhL